MLVIWIFFEMTGCKAWKAIGSKGSHAKSKGWDSHHRRHRGEHLFNLHLMKYADHYFTLEIVWSSAEAVIDGWLIISFKCCAVGPTICTCSELYDSGYVL